MDILVLLCTMCTENLNTILERHFSWLVCTWEMVIRWWTLSINLVVRANQRRSLQLANRAFVLSKVLECKKEIIQIRTDNSLLCTFWNLWCPHSTVNMHELIYLKWNQSTCNSLLARLLTKDACKFQLRIWDCVVFDFTNFNSSTQNWCINLHLLYLHNNILIDIIIWF